MKTFRFMTGTLKYTCVAINHDDALRVAWQTLRPEPRQWLLIQSTLYEEEAAKIFYAEPGHEYEE